MIALADEVDTNGRLATTLLGTDRMHRGAILADDEAAAYELGIHLEAAMLKRPRLGALHLGPLAADDPRVHALAAGTGVTVAVAVEPVPIVHRQSCLAADHLSAGTRRTLRKSANRLRANGEPPMSMSSSTGPPSEAACLPWSSTTRRGTTPTAVTAVSTTQPAPPCGTTAPKPS